MKRKINEMDNEIKSLFLRTKSRNQILFHGEFTMSSQ